MGVPHLITVLRPFAASVNLADVSGVVIDGPGLAYHVWHICLVTQSRFRNPFEGSPSYRMLGEAVIRFLDEFDAHGVCVKKILFDGHLPSTKRSTRLSRLVKYTKQLYDYYWSYSQMIPSTFRDAAPEPSVMKLFNVEAVPTRLGRLSAPPFLVPAIIEVLLTSERYSGIVEVVPGEADAYCAQYLRISGGIVLTGDSDLLVHDLGSGSVTFFGDVEKVHASKIECLRSTQYKVGDIADRLLLPKSHGMKSLAFELTLNSHGSFRELLQQAVKLASISRHGNSYQEFAAEYENNITCKKSILIPDKSHISATSRALKRIDPRISEFLLQLPTFSRASGMSDAQLTASDATRGTANVFLPFLLDCPTRSSAWEMSTSIRQLAYALANLALPTEEQVVMVVEYRRLQNSASGKELGVPIVQCVPEECAKLIELFSQIRGGIPGLPADQFWRALGVYQDLALNTGSTKNTLSAFTVGTPSPRLAWDGIHSFAQFHGSYYSFRILKQILGVVISTDDSSLFPPILHRLWNELESLPSIADLTSVIDFVQFVGSPVDKEIMNLACQILGIDVDVIKAEVARRGKGSRKQKKKSEKTNQALEGLKSNNPFAVLDME